MDISFGILFLLFLFFLSLHVEPPPPPLIKPLSLFLFSLSPKKRKQPAGPFAQYGSNDFGGRIQPGCINDRFRYATCSCKRIDENSGGPPTLVDGTVEWVSGRAPLPVMQPRGL